MINIESLINRAELLSEQNTELEWRDSIKHSYYYLYHKVNNFLGEKNVHLMDRNYGEHQFVIEKLRSINHKVAKSLARDLQVLKDKRVMSCYKLDRTINKIQAKQQLKDCKNAIIKLSRLSEDLQEK